MNDGRDPGRSPVPRAAARVALGAGKLVLVAATLICLASIGGAMLVAWPVLVPLHWLAARNRGPHVTAGWAFLAAASVFEGVGLLAYLVVRSPAAFLVGGAAAALAVVVAFLRRGADLAARRAVALARPGAVLGP